VVVIKLAFSFTRNGDAMNRLLFAFASVLVLIGGVAAGAADKPEDEPYRPQVVKLDQGLTLIDAVRLTLQNDPNIKLQTAELAFKAGRTRELHGQFDFTLRSNVGYQYTRDELRDSVKEREQKLRDDIERNLPLLDSILAGLNQSVINLRNPNVLTNPGAVDLTSGITDPTIKQQMLRIETQMRLFATLIQQTTDANLRNNLDTMRQDILRDGIKAFEDQVKALSGVPDQVRQTRANLGDAPEEQYSKRSDFHLDLLKQFGFGLIVSPYAELRYTAQNYMGKDRTDSEFGGQGVPNLYRGEIGFDVRMPLLRGLGAGSVQASERASKRDQEAARLSLLHQESQSVLQTVTAYWDARAAADSVEVSKRSVTLQDSLVTLTRALIKAGEKPKADESRVMASLLDAQGRVEQAQRRLHEARVNLARVMGVALQDSASLPLPTDPFPGSAPGVAAEGKAVAALIASALTQRFDVQAAVKLREAQAFLARGAGIDKRLKLDLDSSLWGVNIGEDSRSNMNRWIWRSGSAGLTFEAPIGNNQAGGRYDQRKASLDQASIDAADLSRNVALNVERLALSLQLAAERLKRAQDAVGFYDKTIDAEQQKLKAGDSTLVDTVLTEQQTTSARLGYVQAQQEFATTLARLRFEAGQLVSRDGEQARITGDTLVAVPAPIRVQ